MNNIYSNQLEVCVIKQQYEPSRYTEKLKELIRSELL